MRESCCVRAPRALVLAALLLLLAGSSPRAHVADGVRTTPSPADATAGAALGPAAARDASRGSHDGDSSVVMVRPERASATGSRVPDCAHACGACSPCRRVLVSFRCAQEASESCPVAYRCMCRGRFFRVPSL